MNDCNERIVRHGLKVICSSDSQGPGDTNGSGDGSTSSAARPKSSSQKQPNQGLLLIDATCAPVDISHPTDLSLLNVDAVFSGGVAKEATEILIDEKHPHRESCVHKPRTHRKQAKQLFLAVALAEGFCKAAGKETPYQQDTHGHQASA